MKRKKLIIILFALLLSSNAIFTEGAELNNKIRMKNKKYNRTARLENIICNRLQCDTEEVPYTNRKCVRRVDRYFKITHGGVPSCLPLDSEGGYLENELFCYANWKVNNHEQCDPLFDQYVDEYGVIDESDGISSSYEICLMNINAIFDLCSFRIAIQGISSICYEPYTQPCYEEYAITGDDEALGICLEAVQWEIDNCSQDLLGQFYFAQDS